MKSKLDRALLIAETAKSHGEMTPKLAVWVTAAWVSFAAEAVVSLADPTELVDKEELQAVLLESWGRVRSLVDNINMNVFPKFMWTAIRVSVPSLIPSIVTYLAEELDKGELK
jgi:hypothetical protein